MEYIGLVFWLIGLTVVVRWAQTFDRKHYDLLGKQKYFIGASVIFCLIAAITLSTQGLKKGLDFSGGTIFELGSYKEVTTTEVADTLADFPGLGSVAAQVGTGLINDPHPTEGQPDKYQKVIVRLTLEDGSPLDPTTTRAALDHIEDKLGGLKELRTASIGPTVSAELTENAVKALLIALVGQLVYLYFRFGNQIRYGLAANLAMLHDVLIMLGFYALAGREIDSPFVAALLTIVGYSVMDSVVIFDRIRENLNDWWAEHGEDKTAPFDELVNVSLCQTMTRSANTTLTSLISLLAIYYFGGETLQNFAFALMVGILGGAYSSIGLAAPMLCWINKKYPIEPPSSSTWYDTDEVVPEDHMESDDEVRPSRRTARAAAPMVDDEAPRTSGRRRSRGRRD